jgi:hypothetical protein
VQLPAGFELFEEVAQIAVFHGVILTEASVTVPMVDQPSLAFTYAMYLACF